MSQKDSSFALETVLMDEMNLLTRFPVTTSGKKWVTEMKDT